MHVPTWLWSAAALAALAAAAPAPISRRDVSSSTLDQLNLFAQYSAAAYCSANFGGSVGSQLACSVGNCPLVQAANTITLAEFDETTSFGDVTGFVAADTTNDLIVLAFRGSSTVSNWVADLDFPLTDVSSICSGCEVHSGFWTAWSTVASMITGEVESAMAQYPGYSVVFTGHSYGAAIAGIAATVMRNSGYVIQLYDYGQPRLGNMALAEYITAETNGANYRVTHTDDIVPKLPPLVLGYSHFSPEYWITSGNDVTVTTSDVQLVVGINSENGNDGTLLSSTSAHSWYFVNIDAC